MAEGGTEVGGDCPCVKEGERFVRESHGRITEGSVVGVVVAMQ